MQNKKCKYTFVIIINANTREGHENSSIVRCGKHFTSVHSNVWNYYLQIFIYDFLYIYELQISSKSNILLIIVTLTLGGVANSGLLGVCVCAVVRFSGDPSELYSRCTLCVQSTSHRIMGVCVVHMQKFVQEHRAAEAAGLAHRCVFKNISVIMKKLQI